MIDDLNEEAMTQINDTFTSTGAKFFAHEEVMAKLRNGRVSRL